MLSIRRRLAWDDPELNAQYIKFNQKKSSLFSLTAVAVFFTFVTFPFIVLYFISSIQSKDSAEHAALFASWLLQLVLLLVFWLLVALKFAQSKPSLWYAEKLNFLFPFIPVAQDVILLLIAVFCGSKLLIRVEIGQCSDISYSKVWSCNPHDITKGVPIESMVTAMLLPLIYCVTLRDTKFLTLWMSWFIIMAFVVASIVIGKATHAVSAALVYIPASAFILYDNQRQNLMMFFKTLEAEKLFNDLKEIQAADRANEMRHMIANVAHDLKTPLASFLSGTEVIGSIVHDFKQTLATSPGELTIPFAQSAMDHIQTCVQNIRGTNSFMVMAINRCIDFTKASQGLKLVPKLDTIDLAETLALPFHMMRDMQSKVSIEMRPIPTLICSHIITDAQWLQENVLCLLSNASKYSNRGKVAISLTIMKRTSSGELKKYSTGSPVAKNNRKRSHLFSVPNTIRVQRVFPESEQLEIQQDSPSVTLHAQQPQPGETEEDDVQEISLADHLLRIEVEDEGIGLSDEAMQNLFNPFKQAQRLAGGTGLGLYSLAKRVEALKGEYGVERRHDGKEGSVFWFAIPYRPDESVRLDMLPSSLKHAAAPSIRKFNHSSSSGMETTATSLRTITNQRVSATADPSPLGRVKMDTEPLGNAPNGEALRILLVDDSVPILKMTSMMLRRQGHTVILAENGADALEKLSSSTSVNNVYDVVLMDLQMPIMDGLEAVRRLRKLEHAENTAVCKERSPPSKYQADAVHQLVIGVSANSDEETMQTAFVAGVDGFMCKPFSLGTFYDTYRNIRHSAGNRNSMYGT